MVNKNITAKNGRLAIDHLMRPLVFTNGVFDILHVGHVTYLSQAKSRGASLIVALNSDASVKRLNKGSDRPINKIEDRAAVIAALGCVDAVISFDEDTPLELILTIKPDILIKGGDWPQDKIVGSSEIKAWGGVTHSIPFEHDTSTTRTIERIRRG